MPRHGKKRGNKNSDTASTATAPDTAASGINRRGSYKIAIGSGSQNSQQLTEVHGRSSFISTIVEDTDDASDQTESSNSAATGNEYVRLLFALDRIYEFLRFPLMLGA